MGVGVKKNLVILQQVNLEAVVGMGVDAESAGKMGILLGTALLVEGVVGIISVEIAERRDTWQTIVLNRRYVAGVGKRGIWLLTVQSRKLVVDVGRKGIKLLIVLNLRNASTADRKDTILLIVPSRKSVGGAKKKGTG